VSDPTPTSTPAATPDAPATDPAAASADDRLNRLEALLGNVVDAIGTLHAKQAAAPAAAPAPAATPASSVTVSGVTSTTKAGDPVTLAISEGLERPGIVTAVLAPGEFSVVVFLAGSRDAGLVSTLPLECGDESRPTVAAGVVYSDPEGVWRLAG
jgi:hypothetical protein